jgi:predicted nucleic acid-binding protein
VKETRVEILAIVAKVTPNSGSNEKERIQAVIHRYTIDPGSPSPIHDRPGSPMRDLMRKYRDLPMDLADAALVRVAEREKIARVFTIDRRDFELYRPRGLPRFTILP